MPKAAFTTLGCKVNQYETQSILESFERGGFDIVPIGETADVYVINTCSVTGQAESKSHQTVRSLARRNPNAKIVVTGCAAQMALNERKSFEAAHLLVPNPEKLSTFERFVQAFPEFSSVERKAETEFSRFFGRSRATIKIQDGCSVMCSYCSIPFTRPVMTSRNFEHVVNEARRYARLGHQEIILAGVLIGSYGPETGSGGPDFEQLIEKLCELPEVKRIRISSIEMRQVSNRLIAMMSEKGSKIAPHLHIPLQSGSTKVLKDMHRPYAQDDFVRLCETVYDRIHDVAITTDIMVGFPTETDEDFEQTVRVCERIRFAKGHIFRFSLRPGTPAHKWGDAVSAKTKQERSARLIEITNQTRDEFSRRFVGRKLTAAVEGKRSRDGLLTAITGNYIHVEFPGPEYLAGKVVPIRIVSAQSGCAAGDLAADRLPLRMIE